jgi:hypothetical protein
MQRVCSRAVDDVVVGRWIRRLPATRLRPISTTATVTTVSQLFYLYIYYELDVCYEYFKVVTKVVLQPSRDKSRFRPIAWGYH